MEPVGNLTNTVIIEGKKVKSSVFAYYGKNGGYKNQNPKGLYSG